MTSKQLEADSLIHRCAPEQFSFNTTAELEKPM